MKTGINLPAGAQFYPSTARLVLAAFVFARYVDEMLPVWRRLAWQDSALLGIFVGCPGNIVATVA